MHRMPDIDVLLARGSPQEIGALTEILQNCRTLAFRGQTLWWGNYAHLVVVVAATGLGKVNAAITTASLLEWLTVSQVWHLGCTGAYSGGSARNRRCVHNRPGPLRRRRSAGPGTG